MGEEISRPDLKTSGLVHHQRNVSVSQHNLTVTVMSCIKVSRNVFFTLGIKEGTSRDWSIVPRRYQEFRDMHGQLLKEFGEVMVPEFPVRKMAQQEKDLQPQLQVYLDNLLMYDDLVGSKAVKAFLDPLESPSYYSLTEVLKAKKQGKMMMNVKGVWRQFLFSLLNSLYYFKSEDDPVPAGVLGLEYVTLELVAPPQKAEPSAPKHIFKILDLLNNSETLLGLDTTKEVGEWILALREAKVNKMGLGYWVKEEGSGGDEDHTVLPETLLQRQLELNTMCQVFRDWLADDSKVKKPKDVADMCSILDSKPVEVNWEMEMDNPESIHFREGEEGTVVLSGATKERLLQLLLDFTFNDEFVESFVLVYRLFMGTSELFLTIVNYFVASNDFNVQERVWFVLSKWVELHYYDFARDARLGKLLVGFVSCYGDEQNDSVSIIRNVISAHVTTDER